MSPSAAPLQILSAPMMSTQGVAASATDRDAAAAFTDLVTHLMADDARSTAEPAQIEAPARTLSSGALPVLPLATLVSEAESAPAQSTAVQSAPVQPVQVAPRDTVSVKDGAAATAVAAQDVAVLDVSVRAVVPQPIAARQIQTTPGQAAEKAEPRPAEAQIADRAEPDVPKTDKAAAEPAKDAVLALTVAQPDVSAPVAASQAVAPQQTPAAPAQVTAKAQMRPVAAPLSGPAEPPTPEADHPAAEVVTDVAPADAQPVVQAQTNVPQGVTAPVQVTTKGQARPALKTYEATDAPTEAAPVKDEAPAPTVAAGVALPLPLPLPVIAAETRAVPVKSEANVQTRPTDAPLPDLAERPMLKTEDVAETKAGKADVEAIKTQIAAVKLDTPEAVKPSPAPSAAFSIQPVVAEASATPYASTPQAATPVTAQGSALSHTAVEQMTQLSVAIQKRLGDGTTKFQLELKPTDLGRIDVALTITAGGKVSAHLEFDTPVTATTFAARESELRQQLTAAGLKIDGDALTFSSRPAEATQQTQAQAQNQSQNQAGSFTAFADPQAGQQPRSTPRQAARALKQADKTAAEADLDAALVQLRQRPGSGRLALDLTV